jgi:type IV secretory pathway TraG/TraD family ATPase VirD4
MTTILLCIAIAIIILTIIFGREEIPDHSYHACFGNNGDYLSTFNHGFALGDKAFTKCLSVTNCLLLGPTSAGKSSVGTIPAAVSLSRGNSSIIFNDVSGEIWTATSSFLAKRGYKIMRLDFSNSSRSESFNPLLECKTVSDIQKLALIIIQNSIGESKGEIFWENASIMLISLFARYLVFHEEPSMRTLQNVQRLIERFATDGKSVDKLFLKIKNSDENLFTIYKSTIVMGEKTLQSVIATTRTALNLFNDPEVCKTTVINSIDFNMLRKEKVAIYVSNPLKDLKYFKPLSALFFQSLFNYTLSYLPDDTERHIFFVLEEFASMKFPDIALTISNIRKYKAGILLCMQDEMALSAQYGQAESHQIKTNCGIQIYLKGQPLHTCKELSQIFGRYTYETESGSQKVRELLTVDEIRMCDDALILINNQAPLRYAAVPYYKSFWLRHLRTEEAVAFNSITTVNPPLLQFE